MIFFESFYGMLRIVLVAIIFYVSFIIFMRISGKRSTSQMNNFDWLITVTLASMLGTTILVKEVVVLDGLLGAAILLGLNVVLTKVVFYEKGTRKLLYDQPALLYFNGTFLPKEMEAERVTEDEILAAIRRRGFGNMKEVGAVILETNSSLSVLPKGGIEDDGLVDLMVGVRGYPEAAAAKAKERDAGENPEQIP